MVATHRTVCVKFKLLETYYWLKLYKQHEVHTVKNANDCMHNCKYI